MHHTSRWSLFLYFITILSVVLTAFSRPATASFVSFAAKSSFRTRRSFSGVNPIIMEANNHRKRHPSSEVIDLMASSDSEGDNESENEVEIVKAPSRKKPPPAAAKKKARREPLEVTQSKNTATATSSAASLAASSSKSREKLQQQGKNQRKFSVATYNIWFNMQANPDERMMALSQALLAQNTSDAPLLFIGFQEVTAALWATLKPMLESAGYRLFCQEEAIYGGFYGCALAVLPQTRGGVKIIQHGFQPYRDDITCQGRGFLHVRAQLPDSTKQVLFTTTHLESFLPPGQAGPEKYTGSTQREQQVQAMETFCHHHMKRFPDLSLAMISGDLNWDDERIQSTGEDKELTSVLSSKEWTDTWFSIRDKRRLAVMGKNGKVKKKDEPTCYTYDAKDNPMLGGSLRRRFDRILVRTQNGVSTTVEDIELIGREKIGDTTWTKESQWNGRVTSKVVPLCPSDHFGFVARLSAEGF